ncbi:LPXTG cell wall anchor domain-containing protein [Arthrobacter sp. zg-ZUI100]|uniref:LPXTG cell wall anchor domain-containing protein n=1 Tax=Arthrobacter jiangjiafuii TaxID=2817475 RepID=UPI001AED327A|nr:LPXTG cell wall anchor domain-containing protein [Arthrobacter jiangjiafuii]MBP3037166.1 LPXTG cell wall anchor domain-containing protein [Arthrobacter jiangjiafuii]
MKKTASALVLAGALTFFGAGAANAVNAPYPAPPVPGGVSNGSPVAGVEFTFSGTGFLPGTTITITITFNGPTPQAAGAAGAGRVGTSVGGPIILSQALPPVTTTADANGNFAYPVTLTEAGTYTLTATGLDPQGNTRTVSSTVTVAAAEGSEAGAEEGGLANTGADSAMLLWGAAGVVALGAGVASVVVARRKNA